MGLRDRIQGKREEKRQLLARAAASQRLFAWQQEHVRLEAFLEASRSFAGRDGGYSGRTVLEDGERVFHTLAGSLIQVSRLPSQPIGVEQGWGNEVARAVIRRAALPRNAYAPREGVPPAIDSGRVAVTNARVLFEGASLRQWRLSDLSAVVHDAELPWTDLGTEREGAAWGLSYDPSALADFRFHLALALASAGPSPEARARLVAAAEFQVLAHEAERPTPLDPPAPPA